MSDVSVHANYLRDLGDELRRRAEGAASRSPSQPKRCLPPRPGACVLLGRVALMQRRAESFGLPMRGLRLDGLDAKDRDLL